ncbi:MAG: hypothetical protein ACE141_14040 [Bryobacteraceae bacterium]
MFSTETRASSSVKWREDRACQKRLVSSRSAALCWSTARTSRPNRDQASAFAPMASIQT